VPDVPDPEEPELPEPELGEPLPLVGASASSEPLVPELPLVPLGLSPECVTSPDPLVPGLPEPLRDESSDPPDECESPDPERVGLLPEPDWLPSEPE
jgi:hypothetical protein